MATKRPDPDERPTDPDKLKVWLLERQVNKLVEDMQDLKALVHRLETEVEERRPPHR